MIITNFIKKDLVSFLNKYEDDFKYTTKPYLIILEEKMGKIMNEIEKSNDKGQKLVARLKVEPDKTFEIHSKIMANNKIWKSLNKEYDELLKMLANE